MKRLAVTLALGLLVALLVVGTGVASAAGTAGQDSATGPGPGVYRRGNVPRRSGWHRQT